MSLNDLFPSDRLLGTEPLPTIAGPTDVGAIDVNPFNYLAAAAQGAIKGASGKAIEDLEDVQDELRGKKKKKKKKKPEPEPEPEPEPAPPPRRFPARMLVRPTFWMRYKQYLIPGGIGAAVLGVVLMKKR